MLQNLLEAIQFNYSPLSKISNHKMNSQMALPHRTKTCKPPQTEIVIWWNYSSNSEDHELQEQNIKQSNQQSRYYEVFQNEPNSINLLQFHSKNELKCMMSRTSISHKPKYIKKVSFFPLWWFWHFKFHEKWAHKMNILLKTKQVVTSENENLHAKNFFSWIVKKYLKSLIPSIQLCTFMTLDIVFHPSFSLAIKEE